MDFKAILKTVLSVLLPVAYSMIFANNPDFPLAEFEFVELALYLIGGILGGWTIQNHRVQVRTGKTIKQL
ncbi:MAG TPA: hypothetical protein VIH28_10135 [Ignavibacteriaceae bacterium]